LPFFKVKSKKSKIKNIGLVAVVLFFNFSQKGYPLHIFEFITIWDLLI